MSHSRFGGGRGGAGGFPPCQLLRHNIFGSSELRTRSEPDQRCGLRAAGTDVATGSAGMAGKEHRTAALAWIGAGALLVALAVGWYLLPISHWLGALRDRILDPGFTGVAIFVAIYVVGAVVLAPEAVLTIGAGFAYGFLGLLMVLIAATIGASLAFLIARYAGRDKVQQLLDRRHKIAAIDRAVAEDGWEIVALLRLSPLIPFNLQNYLFGITAIPFWHFAAATFAGIIPGQRSIPISADSRIRSTTAAQPSGHCLPLGCWRPSLSSFWSLAR
jgi:uncharacterized membrane protein YdjX (TVP38/TMEM64 family)